jgi:hypothetical protein
VNTDRCIYICCIYTHNIEYAVWCVFTYVHISNSNKFRLRLLYILVYTMYSLLSTIHSTTLTKNRLCPMNSSLSIAPSKQPRLPATPPAVPVVSRQVGSRGKGQSPLITSFFQPVTGIRSTKQVSIEIKKEIVKRTEREKGAEGKYTNKIVSNMKKEKTVLPGVLECDVIDLTENDDEIVEIVVPMKKSVECINLIEGSTTLAAKRPRINDLEIMTIDDVQRLIDKALPVSKVEKSSKAPPTIDLISGESKLKKRRSQAKSVTSNNDSKKSSALLMSVKENTSLGQNTATPVSKITIGVSQPCLSITKTSPKEEMAKKIFDTSSFISATNHVLQRSVASFIDLQNSSQQLKTNISIIVNDLNRSTDKNIQSTYYLLLNRVLYDSPAILWNNRYTYEYCSIYYFQVFAEKLLL